MNKTWIPEYRIWLLVWSTLIRSIRLLTARIHVIDVLLVVRTWLLVIWLVPYYVRFSESELVLEEFIKW